MLHARKEREKFGNSTLMEGFLSVSSVIAGSETGVNTRKIIRVLYDAEKEKQRAKELSFLRAKADKHGFAVLPASAEEIDAMTIGGSHGGIVAECTDRSFPTVDESAIAPRGFYVLLEGIEDPYNFGYALRSIYAAGADGIILSERNWMSAAGIVSRSSAGASELMKIFVGDCAEMTRKFKSAGYLILAADKSRDSVSVYDTEMKFPVLLMIGGERRGLSSPVMSLSDKKICLDYGRRFPAALSAASAASIISFEIMRQNRGEK